MSISVESGRALFQLFEAIRSQYDEMYAECSPPSGLGRIKGMLRTYSSIVGSIRDALASRASNKGDLSDLNWMVTSLSATAEEKWMMDELKGAVLRAPDPAILDALTILPPSSQVSYEKSLELLVAGVKAVLSESEAN